jgi:putative membrane-bound dehydrogenase-like protein
LAAFLLLAWGSAGIAIGQGFKEAVVDAPLPAAEAARTMVVPEGFQVTLFASEPDCVQPIGFCIDDRGRLWVAEAMNYPKHGNSPGDRILIFEDADGDGRFDKRTVFYDGLNYVTGIEVGFGGAWVMSPPYFYFIPDQDGDDVPDGEPQVLLDGFGNHANSHNLANGFAWGPDGWLYGTHGRTNWSLLGKPGTPDQQRTRFDGGVYRYHPLRHVWEPFADGSTNPWGIDWNDVGEGFVCNCVNPHLFHVIQGAHYEPWRNRESSQFAYQRIASIADHLHFVGQGNVRDGLGSAAEDTAGGGHAHCGSMVYLGDNWPERYRNQFFTNNIHGRRINNDLLRRAGSGYTASHGHDLMQSKDAWYMGVTLRYGPDGAVFASDWSDTGECHSRENTRRETGRIYKISYGKPSAAPVDLTQLSDLELAELQLHRNDWHVQHARRLLQEHAAQDHDMTEVARRLLAIFSESAEVPRKLRALWALHVIGRLDTAFLVRQLSHESEYLRSWSIRLLCEGREPPADALARFQELAASGDSPYDRLHLASVLQRLEPAQRWPIAEALSQRVEDSADANLPLMLWYGIEPLVNDDLDRFVGLAGTTRIPLIARHIGHRVAGLPEANGGLESLTRLLAKVESNVQGELLAGVIEGLEGRRSMAMPESWPETYATLQGVKNESIRQQSLQLALIFDDPVALAMLRGLATEKTAAVEARNRAVRALVAKQAADLAPLLLELLDDPATRRSALRGLAEYDHPDTPVAVLNAYAAFDAPARQDAVQTLASRPAWAMKLLSAIEAGQVPRSDLSAYTARQLQNLGDADISARIKTLWGELRTTPDEKIKLIARFKKQLTLESLQRADRSAGRAIFQRSCANCHRFFDAGGNIGPDITGAQRSNMDYLLQTLVDPSAAVAKDFQMQIIQTSGGRVITGLVVAESKTAVTIQTVNEKIVVPVDEIEERTISPLSMMPDGLLQNLPIERLRELIAYLMGPAQVPLPVE